MNEILEEHGAGSHIPEEGEILAGDGFQILSLNENHSAVCPYKRSHEISQNRQYYSYSTLFHLYLSFDY